MTLRMATSLHNDKCEISIGLCRTEEGIPMCYSVLVCVGHDSSVDSSVCASRLESCPSLKKAVFSTRHLSIFHSFFHFLLLFISTLFVSDFMSRIDFLLLAAVLLTASCTWAIPKPSATVAPLCPKNVVKSCDSLTKQVECKKAVLVDSHQPARYPCLWVTSAVTCPLFTSDFLCSNPPDGVVCSWVNGRCKGGQVGGQCQAGISACQ